MSNNTPIKLKRLKNNVFAEKFFRKITTSNDKSLNINDDGYKYYLFLLLFFFC